MAKTFVFVIFFGKNLYFPFLKICRKFEGTDAAPFRRGSPRAGHRHLEITVARLCEKQVFD